MWTIWLFTQNDSTTQESYDPGEFSDSEAFRILQQMIDSVLMQGEEEEAAAPVCPGIWERGVCDPFTPYFVKHTSDRIFF